jgi:hypothetical protein
MPCLDSLRAVAAQHGVVLRCEALALGWDDRDLRRACAGGVLHKVRHGCYVPAEVWRALDDRGRHLVLARAALRCGMGESVLSHVSGSIVHGMDLWDVDLSQVHLTARSGLAGRKRPDTAVHEGSLTVGEVLTKDRFPVTKPVRSALEAASLLDVERGLVVLDSGLHKGLFDKKELAATYEAMKRWPFMRQAQLAVQLADGRSASVGESRSRFLFWSQGIPLPQLQYEIWHNGELLGITDFAWPEHGLLGEFDGKAKYLKHLRPGEKPEDALMREKLREDLIRRVTGYMFVRIVWAELGRPVHTARGVRELLRSPA